MPRIFFIATFALTALAACGTPPSPEGVESQAIGNTCANNHDAIQIFDAVGFSGHTQIFCGVGQADLTQYCTHVGAQCPNFCCPWAGNVRSWQILTGTGTDYLTGEFFYQSGLNYHCSDSFNSDSGSVTPAASCTQLANWLNILSDN